MSTEERVLQSVLNSTNPILARSISKTLDIGKNVVNRSLYELLRSGKVQRTEENPPYWTATTAAFSREAAATNTTGDHDGVDSACYDQQENLLLRTMGGSTTTRGISSYSIALEMGKSLKVVNSMLYSLENDGKILL